LRTQDITKRYAPTSSPSRREGKHSSPTGGGWERVRIVLLPFFLFGFILLLAGCGSDQSGGGGGDANLDAPTVLSQAISATNATTSFHFKIDVKGQTAAGSAFYILGGEGDYAKPNQVSAKVDAVYAGATVEAQYAGKGDQQYIVVIGCWQPFAGLTLAPDKAATDIMNNIASLNKSGVENIDGLQNHHLTGKINAQQLAALSPEAVQTNTVNVDLWVGVADKQLHRVLLSGAISRGDAANASYDIHFSDFNKPVTVNLPPASDICKGK
jgi:LppX_LprAFG lipoprotein